MRAKDSLLMCVCLLTLALAFSYPIARYFTEGMPYSFMPVPGHEVLHQHPGDYIQLMYRFWLFERALAGKIPFFTNAYEFSTPVTPPTFTPQGIPVSIIFMLFMPLGNIAAYNILVLLSFIAAGLSLALLVHELTGSRGAAFVCGVLYACVPYRLGHLFGGHMGGFVQFLLPLSVYFLEKAWPSCSCRGGLAQSGSSPLRWGVASGICLACAAPLELYVSFYMGALLGLYVLLKFCEAIVQRGLAAALRESRGPVLGLLLPCAVALGYLLWVKLSILESSVAKGGRSLGSVQGFSPTLKDLLRKSPNAERNIYLGFIPYALAVYGFFTRRSEIARGEAEKGALLWLYFWAMLFGVCFLMALGTTLEAYVPFYKWVHAHVPFMAYSRASIRILSPALVGFFMLCAYGVRRMCLRGRAAQCAVWLLCLATLADYHTKRPIGVSLLRGMDSVYEEVRDRAAGKRLLELPLWPGDSAWSAIYEYYATLTCVPIVNGYNPAPQLAYVDKVYTPLRTLNLGEMRRGQYETLRGWDVPYIVLHQDLFPRRISPFPFRFTVLNLLDSLYLEFTRRDGPHYLFRVREKPAGPEPTFSRRSPVGVLYPAQNMKRDIGDVIHDEKASSGRCLCTLRGGSGFLMRGGTRLFPTGEFRAAFRLRLSAPERKDARAWIEVYALEQDRVLASRELALSDFPGPAEYGLFEIAFRNDEPVRVEPRVRHNGVGELRADFAYVRFAGEEDPGVSYEAEDLFHIGTCVEDRSASGGQAVAIGKNEDLHAPLVEGPYRLYGPGRYRARFSMRAERAEPGVVAGPEVASGFGGSLVRLDVTDEEFRGQSSYTAIDLPFELKKPVPLSFLLRHYNKAFLWLDKIDVERVRD